ncbi:MAG: hypothetical protein HPY44_16230 [Armatimonadetes bacterium]|nr:hypothetical protein [Armatimonadota bacterium]
MLRTHALARFPACILLVCATATSLASDVQTEYVYTTDQGLEPDQTPGSPWASSRLGTAQIIPGSPPRLLTTDDSPQADGRFYFLALKRRQVGPGVPVRLELRMRVLSSSGSLAATCVQVCVEDRRFGLGFDPGAAGPGDDRVLLLDFAAGGAGQILGELPLPLDVMRDYVLEVHRAYPGTGDSLRLVAGDAGPLSVPWESLARSAISAYYGLLVGHPVGGGLGQAEWERISLTCAGTVANTGPRTIGPQRQLLADDWLIESTSNLTRVQCKPEKYPNNPVLVRDKPWEASRTELYGSAFWDPTVQKLRLYYSAMVRPYDLHQAYAESDDLGRTWTKPKLGIMSFEGQDTNFVYPGRYWPHGPSVFLDPQDSDPARRYKLFTADYPIPLDSPRNNGEPGIDVAFSPDGIHWTPSEHNPVIPGFISDTGQCAFWDPRLERYVAYVRMWSGERCVGRTESLDFEEWSTPELVYSPEPADRRNNWQFYSMSVTPYEGMYVGLVWIFPAVPASGDWDADTPVTWPELVVSRDSYEWTRVAPGEAFLPLGPVGSFDHRQIRTASSFVVLPDRILLIYSGSPHPHVKEHKFDIGCASLRVDGFAAMHAGDEGGTLVTRPLICAPGELLINARTEGDGYVAAEVLGEDGQPLPGYSREECLQFTGDSLSAPLAWGGQLALPANPKGLRLRFLLRNADLYSFRVTPEE